MYEKQAESLLAPRRVSTTTLGGLSFETLEIIMAKDPAFLFYPGDWMGGTVTMTRSHKGAYMDLLVAQHNCGHMTLHDIQFVLGADFESMWESKLKSKFEVDAEGKFYNQKLENEIVKRKNFTESRKKNFTSVKKVDSHMDHHTESRMENENENENIVINNKGVENKKFTPPKQPEVYSYFLHHEKTTGWTPTKCSDQSIRFINHYESNGWRVGKNKMKNWHAAASGWIGRCQEFENNGKSEPKPAVERVGRMAKSDLENFINSPTPNIEL